MTEIVRYERAVFIGIKPTGLCTILKPISNKILYLSLYRRRTICIYEKLYGTFALSVLWREYICMKIKHIYSHRHSRAVSGRLREEIELLGAEVIFVSKEYFLGDASAFANNLRRDYRRVL